MRVRHRRAGCLVGHEPQRNPDNSCSASENAQDDRCEDFGNGPEGRKSTVSHGGTQKSRMARNFALPLVVLSGCGTEQNFDRKHCNIHAK